MDVNDETRRANETRCGCGGPSEVLDRALPARLHRGVHYGNTYVRPTIKGRGTPANPPNRFESQHFEPEREPREQREAGPQPHGERTSAQKAVCADAAGGGMGLDGTRPPVEGSALPATRLYADNSKTLINRVDSPDLGFRWTINPYRGCEHGCIYCYARPYHEQLGFSCGLDFETRIAVKYNAAEILRRELGHPRWAGEPIVMCGVTDAYQPIERRLGITRSCLEVMAESRQPVSIATKNRLVLRDLDLLTGLARYNAASVAISLTTLDPELSARMEPRASCPADRLAAIRRLAEAEVPVSVLLAPIIPGLNDCEIPRLLREAASAGATGAGWILLRLPHQNRFLFMDWLARWYPDRARRIEGAIRHAREGKLSDANFGSRMRGSGAHAQLIQRTFNVFCERYGLNSFDRSQKALRQLSSAAFRRPQDDGSQMFLFEAGG